MTKRFLDFILSLFGLLIIGPLLIFFIFLVWLEDYANPFYFASRVGKNNKSFKMIKIRSMVVDADKKGAETIGLTDKRITKIGKKIRKYKIDELSQLLNVLVGDMSLVGPRTQKKLKNITAEQILLKVKPASQIFHRLYFQMKLKWLVITLIQIMLTIR